MRNPYTAEAVKARKVKSKLRMDKAKARHQGAKARLSTLQANDFDRKAGQQEARALKMAKKHGRGGRRSAKAAQTAQGLRSGADQLRIAHAQPHQPVPTSPPPPQTLPGAAWYPDPKGEKRLRWWDGATWTEHTAD
jgi:hypothetical protein